MIVLPNGHRFQFMAASGALAFDGRGWPWEWPLRWCGLLDPRLFTIVTKSLTRHPRRGNLRWWNPCGSVRLMPSGVVNAIGLTNPGIDWWCRVIGPRLDRLPYRLVGSIMGESPEEWGAMAAMLDPFPLAALELNCSCPNTADAQTAATANVLAAVERAGQCTRHPIIVKLAVTHDYCAIARALAGRVAAIAINSVPWAVAFPKQTSPLVQHGDGGVSGRAAQIHTWTMVQDLCGATDIPIIGPSVWEYADMARLQRLGAQAISFGSIFLRYPWRPTQYIRRYRREKG
jgi:dihydroorotate dehydrogenase (NAD+) catalytic subunit